MHVQHARPPRRHIQPVPQPRRPRARDGRARRLAPLLEPREAHLHPGDDDAPHHARRGRVLVRLEPGRQVGHQRRRGRHGQGVCAMKRLLSSTIIGTCCYGVLLLLPLPTMGSGKEHRWYHRWNEWMEGGTSFSPFLLLFLLLTFSFFFSSKLCLKGIPLLS